MELSCLKSFCPGARILSQSCAQNYSTHGLEDILVLENSRVIWYSECASRVVRTFICEKEPLDAVFCVLDKDLTPASISASSYQSETNSKSSRRRVVTVAILLSPTYLRLYQSSGEHSDIQLSSPVDKLFSVPSGLLLQGQRALPKRDMRFPSGQHNERGPGLFPSDTDEGHEDMNRDANTSASHTDKLHPFSPQSPFNHNRFNPSPSRSNEVEVGATPYRVDTHWAQEHGSPFDVDGLGLGQDESLRLEGNPSLFSLSHPSALVTPVFSASESGMAGGGLALPGSPMPMQPRSGPDDFGALFRGTTGSAAAGGEEEGDLFARSNRFTDTRADIGAHLDQQQLAAFSNEEERVMACFEGLVVTANMSIEHNENYGGSDSDGVPLRANSVRLGLWSIAEPATTSGLEGLLAGTANGNGRADLGATGVSGFHNTNNPHNANAHDGPNMSTIAEESQALADFALKSISGTGTLDARSTTGSSSSHTHTGSFNQNLSGQGQYNSAFMDRIRNSTSSRDPSPQTIPSSQIGLLGGRTSPVLGLGGGETLEQVLGLGLGPGMAGGGASLREPPSPTYSAQSHQSDPLRNRGSGGLPGGGNANLAYTHSMTQSLSRQLSDGRARAPGLGSALQLHMLDSAIFTFKETEEGREIQEQQTSGGFSGISSVDELSITVSRGMGVSSSSSLLLHVLAPNGVYGRFKVEEDDEDVSNSNRGLQLQQVDVNTGTFKDKDKKSTSFSKKYSSVAHVSANLFSPCGGLSAAYSGSGLGGLSTTVSVCVRQMVSAAAERGVGEYISSTGPIAELFVGQKPIGTLDLSTCVVDDLDVGDIGLGKNGSSSLGGGITAIRGRGGGGKQLFASTASGATLLLSIPSVLLQQKQTSQSIKTACVAILAAAQRHHSHIKHARSGEVGSMHMDGSEAGEGESVVEGLLALLIVGERASPSTGVHAGLRAAFGLPLSPLIFPSGPSDSIFGGREGLYEGVVRVCASLAKESEGEGLGAALFDAVHTCSEESLLRGKTQEAASLQRVLLQVVLALGGHHEWEGYYRQRLGKNVIGLLVGETSSTSSSSSMRLSSPSPPTAVSWVDSLMRHLSAAAIGSPTQPVQSTQDGSFPLPPMLRDLGLVGSGVPCSSGAYMDRRGSDRTREKGGWDACPVLRASGSFLGRLIVVAEARVAQTGPRRSWERCVIDAYCGSITWAKGVEGGLLPKLPKLPKELQKSPDPRLRLLKSLPPLLRSFIELSLYQCRMSADSNDWSDEVLQYIGRDDLCRDASARLALGSAGFGRVHSSAVTATALCSTRIHASESNRNARTHGTAGLMQAQRAPQANQQQAQAQKAYNADVPDGLEDVEVEAGLRFSEDDRMREVCRMLCSSKSIYLKVDRAPETSDQDLRHKQQLRLLTLCRRSLATSVGRGMLTMGSLGKVRMAEALPVPPLTLTGRVPPNDSIVQLDPASVPPELTLWPEFHNGVAAGLRVAVNMYAAALLKSRTALLRESGGKEAMLDHASDAGDVTRNWILYNRTAAHSAAQAANLAAQGANAPATVGGDSAIASHAGVLLALGLQGHLKVLTAADICDYLTQGHEPTTIAVLVGIAASRLGSADPRLSKTLCLHLPSLLPSRHWDIDISPHAQTAALAGLGLLHVGSGHRLMTEFLLSELTRMPTSERSDARECMSLTAAWALGLVLLGRGRGTVPPVHTAGSSSSRDTKEDKHGLDTTQEADAGDFSDKQGKGKKGNSATAINSSVYISSASSERGPLGSGGKENGEGGHGAMGGLADLRVEDRLCACFQGGVKPPESHLFPTVSGPGDASSRASRVLEGGDINVDITGPGAIIALGMIYIRSNNPAIAGRMSLPDTVYSIDQCRPDMFLYRSLARCLVMWDSVLPTERWIQQQVPLVVRKVIFPSAVVVGNDRSESKEGSKGDDHIFLSTQGRARANTSPEGAEEESKGTGSQKATLSPRVAINAYLCTIAGSGFGMGLVYAGTGDLAAKQAILAQLKIVQSLRDNRPCFRLPGQLQVDRGMRPLIDMCVCVLAGGLSLVMAGSGDVDCLRTFRELRWKVDDVVFGTHLALGMAVGMLFLGGGSFSVKRDDVSVACLMMRYVLAVERRILRTVDVDSGASLPVRVAVEMMDGNVRYTDAPCLLPELSAVKAVRVDVESYQEGAVGGEGKMGVALYPTRLELEGAGNSGCGVAVLAQGGNVQVKKVPAPISSAPLGDDSSTGRPAESHWQYGEVADAAEGGYSEARSRKNIPSARVHAALHRLLDPSINSINSNNRGGGEASSFAPTNGLDLATELAMLLLDASEEKSETRSTRSAGMDVSSSDYNNKDLAEVDDVLAKAVEECLPLVTVFGRSCM